MLVLVIIPILAVIYVAWFMFSIAASRIKFKHMYVPKYRSFLLGHLKELKDFKGRFSEKMLEWSAESRYECFVLFSFQRNHVHLVNNKKIRLALNTPILMKAKKNNTLSFFDGNRVVGYTSIITEPGTHIWTKKRKLLGPYFHTFGLQRFLEDIKVVSNNMIAEINKECMKGSAVDITSMLKKHVTLIIARSIFEIEDTKAFNQCIPLLNSVFYGIFIQSRNKNTFFLPWVERKLKSEVHKSIFELRKYLRNHLLSYDINKNERGCFRQVILSNTDDNGQLDIEGCIDDMIVYFFAGIDTSFNTMNFALYQMLKSPELLPEIQSEVFKVYGDKDELRYTDIKKLYSLDAFLRETLRLFPTALFASKVATEDFVLCGALIPKNTFVHVNIVCVQQAEKYWENPKKFDIKRWLEPPVHFSFIPFSGGTRGCLGKQLAMMEMKVLLSAIIKNFEIDFDGTEVKDIGIREHITSGLSENLHIKFKQRKKEV